MTTRVVRFTASWCQPCSVFAPIFDETSERFQVPFDVYDIETEQGGKLAKELGVMQIPAVFVLSDGESRKIPLMKISTPDDLEAVLKAVI